MTPWGAGGAGRFGTWIRDDHGLPAFRYELDQFNDPLGEWRTLLLPQDPEPGEHLHSGVASLSGDDAAARLRRLESLRPPADPDRSNVHWHQIGNDRYVAVHTDDGWTQVYSHEFGPRWLNVCRPEVGAYAGGVSYVRADGATTSTLFGAREPGDQVERTWGCSYGQVAVTNRLLRLDRTVFAPFGDSPFIMALVRISNLGDAPLEIEHLEFWDLAPHLLDPTGPEAWQFDSVRRDRLSRRLFSGYGAAWDAGAGVLIARHPWREIVDQSTDWPGGSQRVRPDVSLVPLGVEPARTLTDRRQLFPDKDPYQPAFADDSRQPAWGEEVSEQPVLGIVSRHELAPAGEVVLGFAYGATAAAETAREVAAVRRQDAGRAFAQSMRAWRERLPRVRAGDDNLGREAAWSAYYLRSGAVYHRGLRAHTLPQGGAYQYLGGINAGPRATLQHALPLVWLEPELTKEAIRFTMSETHPSGEIPYAEVANGQIDALRYVPSDHDLWLLWALSEYVLATRDRQFLNEVCSYWPPPYTRPEPVWQHALRAFDHLVGEVGVGPHGLVRMRTSDWNDAIVREGRTPIERVWTHGESTLNTAMAVHVCRRFAELARLAGDPRAERRSRAYAERLAIALGACWRETHLNRGWRDANDEVGWSDLYLEPQPWALIAGVLTDEQRRTLVDTIDRRLADPLGARIFGAGEEGNPPTAGGGQWLSINSTLVWGLAKVDPERAWRELRANTLHNHAEVYPDVWAGVWSGPDTYLPSTSARAGQTWAWPGVFSMQAWPVQILFAHSELLNGLLWMMGVEAGADTIRVRPRLPLEEWSWRSHQLTVDYQSDAITCALTLPATDRVRLEITLPDDWAPDPVEIRDPAGTRRQERSDGTVAIDLLLVGGAETRVEVRRVAANLQRSPLEVEVEA